MKKSSSKIREEIVHLQSQLRAAETREAERIGRVALRAGLADLDVEEGDLLSALEEIAARFRKRGAGTKVVRAAAADEPAGPGAKAATEA